MALQQSQIVNKTKHQGNGDEIDFEVAVGSRKRVAFSSRSSRRVELPICQAAVAMFLLCTLICTISGLIVYHVVQPKIDEIDRRTSQSHATMQATLDDVIETVKETEKKQNSSGQQVAFAAHGATGTTVNDVLTFRNVDLNIGTGYDQTTGRFMCPVAGTYLFSVTLMTVDTRSAKAYCWIRKNATDVALVNSYEGTWDSASVSVILHLSVGDLVDLGGCGNVNDIHTASGYTWFISHLIQAD